MDYEPIEIYDEPDTRTHVCLILSVIFLFFMACFLTKASAADIKECQKRTGYTIDRCLYELNH